MFEEMIKELKKLDGTTQLTVSLPSDEDGYLDRECPSSDCEFEFKIHEDDWRDKVRDEEVFCPFCRHTGTLTRGGQRANSSTPKRLPWLT